MTGEYGDVAERLERRFGLGSDPDRRRKLYERLQRACEQHGDLAYKILTDVACAAQGARSPDRYFCHGVMARLRESGLNGETDEPPF